MRVCTGLALSVLALVADVLPAAAQTGTTALFVDSQPGDYIGQGARRTWTPPEMAFSGSVTTDRSSVSISTTAADGTWWTFQFAAPLGTPLTPGVYEHAIEWRSNHQNFVLVSGSGRQCLSAIGRFRVYDIAVSPAGVLERFSADFEQHCEFATPALFGAVRYRSERSSLEPFDGAYPVFTIDIDPVVNGYVSGPGIDCGAGRIDCDETFADATSIALQAIPNAGYVFVGWAGFDCVGVDAVVVPVNRRKSCRPVFGVEPGGSAVEIPSYAANAAYLDMYGRTHEVAPVGGRSQLVAAPPYAYVTPKAVSPSGVTLSIDHDGIATAEVTFGAPPGEVLEPGVYEPAGLLFIPNSTTSGPDALFQLVLRGRPCETSGARFQIHEIRISGETLAAFAADFDVRCTWSERVTGSIRYNSSRDTLIPFSGTYPTSTLHVAATAGGYVTGSGISCGDGGRTDCQETSATPAVFGLQALPSPGYDFFGWTGLCSGSAPFATVSVSVVDRCVAVFQPSLGSPVALPPLGSGALVIVRPGSQQQPALSTWVAPDARIVAQALAGSRFLRFTAETLRGTQQVSFSVPSGEISVGTYVMADTSVGSSLGPAVSVQSCSATRGSFSVYEATYNPDGTPLAFAADFELYCNLPPLQYLAGSVRYRSSRHGLRPFGGAYPVIQLSITRPLYGTVTGAGLLCGDGGSDCAETYTTPGSRILQAVPRAGYQFVGWLGDCSGGSYTSLLVDRAVACEPLFRAVRPGIPEDSRLAAGSLTIQSQPGETIGGGTTRTYLTTDWSIFATDSHRSLSVLPWSTGWQLEFRAPGTQALGPGTYEGAVGLSGSSALPRLSVLNSAASCDWASTSGRFIIHELRFASPTSSSVVALSLDFEQRCKNGPPLRGSVRYRSSRSELQPFAGVTPRISTRFDFNGDQNADLVWQNRDDGRLLFWYLNGSAHVFNEPASTPQVPDTNWHIVGNADANGDGHNDLYWQHQTTGALAVWYMRDTVLVSGDAMSPATVPDTNWKVRTVVDLDSDGHPDLIWQHRVSGEIAVWFMTGRVVRSGEALGPGRVADTNWTIVGAGDANGDGSPDLYWHHLGTGQLAIWFMRGVHMLGGELVSPASVPDTNWRVRGIADLDRNGSADLIWQNVATSELAVWLLNGLRLVDGRHITGPQMPAASWTLVGPR